MSWLKVETTTPDKPEMDAISRHCKCSRAEAFLAFFRFYSWADAVSEDGHIRHLTIDGTDERAGMKGFGKALEEVDWLQFNGSGAIIGNFERHNGQSAKRRVLEAERKRKDRR